MKIVADYKRRKELKEYLPHEEHWKLKSDKRVSVDKPAVTPAVSSVLSELSNQEAASLAGDTASKLSTQTSEERKRQGQENDEDSPPAKKCNVDSDVISEEVENNITENGNGA